MNLTIDLSKVDPLFVVLATIVALLVLDWLFGIAAAIKAGVFMWKRLPDQLATIALPYLTPVLAAAVLEPANWHNATAAAASTVLVKLGIEIREKMTLLLLAKAAPAPPSP